MHATNDTATILRQPASPWQTSKRAQRQALEHAINTEELDEPLQGQRPWRVVGDEIIDSNGTVVAEVTW